MVAVARSPERTATLLDRFKESFSSIAGAIEAAPAPHDIIVTEDFQQRAGIGETRTVIVRNLEKERGFGIVWRVEVRRCEGMCNRFFDAMKPDDSPSNAAFLKELNRRLSVEGATRTAIEGRMNWDWVSRGRRAAAFEKKRVESAY
jgi:hypothetical protein